MARRNPSLIVKTKAVAHHRNGVSGRPFSVVLLWDENNGPLLAIRPDNAGPDECYVLNTILLSQGVIEFGENSFRGDQYAAAVDAAIKAGPCNFARGN